MLDERPTAAELIAAVAEFLEQKAMPQLDSATAFHAKVAVNVLRIAQREIEREINHELRGNSDNAHAENNSTPHDSADAAELKRLRALCNAANAHKIADLNRELCARIADGRLATDDVALRAHLLASVRERLAVDNPKYPSLAALPAD